MGKKKTKLQLAQGQTEEIIIRTNEKIDELGSNSCQLYINLDILQRMFDMIRNVPSERRIKYEQLKKIRLNWKQQSDKIESDFKIATVKNVGGTVAGMGAGIAVAALGPTAAMGIATTFGVASTGTAISTLSGAAAMNAALAWLGGGALAAGGGGIAAGDALLALAGPAGWIIAGVALLGSGLFFVKASSEKNRLDRVFTLISKRDMKSYELAIVELNERIIRIHEENSLLDGAINKIQTFGTDYDRMTEAQQYELGSYVNQMESSTQLLVNPIMGLLPKYTEEDFARFVSDMDESLTIYYKEYKKLLVNLSNLLYQIEIDDKDRGVLLKYLKKNKEFLSAMGVDKKDFDDTLMYSVEKCLMHKYGY